MTTSRFRSAFASESFLPEPDIPSAQGSLASFVCHVAHLENELRDESSVFFDDKHEIEAASRKKIGSGASFSVERAEWRSEFNEQGVSSSDQVTKWGKYVAIKSVREASVLRKQAYWRDILLEIRALLHEPLRYHPNIVRLLGLGWGPSAETDSVYPTLILEYAALGSMHQLQSTVPPLPFGVKQKLCYDIARGLSILHACGIVHGDLKHENVLIFKNRYTMPNCQPYTAKLADFGGAVMDITERDLHSLRMGTYPFDAPEAVQRLTENMVKQTDVYSFGMLIWRAFIDGKDVTTDIGLKEKPTETAREELQNLKQSDELLVKAVMSIQSYASTHTVCAESESMILYVLGETIQADPSHRNLGRAQAALRGMSTSEIEPFLQKVAAENSQWDEADRNREPGRHGMTVDSLGFSLGRLGDDYDAQDNTPGYRPNLPHPDAGKFVFEPQKLKTILGWSQQRQIVNEFEQVAQTTRPEMPTELQPWTAAYYLFQCYLTEFGVTFDAKKACHWLYEASRVNDEGDVDYWARAWLWRVNTALAVPVPLTTGQLRDYVEWGLIRGHRNCLEDGYAIIPRLADDDEKGRWERALSQADWILRTMAGGVGMPHYAPRKIRRDYDMDNLKLLDDQIKEELGADYEACLRKDASRPWLSWFSKGRSEEPVTSKDYRFDKIFVNHKGHGLLHYAATMGNLKALKHIIETYLCDVDIPNQSVSESPLVCACRSGHFDCAVFLLDCAAKANGAEHGEEAPLHWICSFSPGQMASLSKKLIAAGADVEKSSGIMRKDVRMINADWEDIFGISVTPLGRAVLMRSLPAVKVLLELGADPFAKVNLGKSPVGKSAVELAAVLTLPHILEVLLSFVDQTREEKPLLFDEIGMLRVAHEKEITGFDSTSLQSRLVRCGAAYKNSMFQTLQILHLRHQKLLDWRNTDSARPIPGMHLCCEVRLGNADIVEALLELGHDPNGSPGYRPIEDAVLVNHKAIFQLLVNRNARVTTKRTVENGRQLSLLQLSASRPRASRSGTFIAEYLIRSGAPLEPLPDGTPSALVFAIKNRYFDLADILLANGANVNAVYQTEQKEEWITVLGELVEKHTSCTLESIDYIFRRQGGSHQDDPNPSSIPSASEIYTTPTPNCNPDFVVNGTRGLTVLHVLAHCGPDVINDKSQISARIISRVLMAFDRPEQINYTHPILGTALCIACMAGSVEMVAALLERNADTTIPARLSLLNDERISLGLPKVPPERERNTPLYLSYAAFETELRILERAATTTLEDFGKLNRLEAVISLLQSAAASNTDGDGTNSEWDKASERKKALEARIGLNDSMARLTSGTEDSKPVDLSVMTEERPTGWKEGDDMDREMALRTFLKYMRKGW
ncbi:MAG: hypothetical protein M1813_007501 [Trichoglossum hirsutum]|nr:MAG: hypothetical protein M1813_007501 [Trichoglossum hirsutum]